MDWDFPAPDQAVVDRVVGQWSEQEQVLLRLGGFHVRRWVETASSHVALRLKMLKLGHPTSTMMQPQSMEMDSFINESFSLAFNLPPAVEHLCPDLMVMIQAASLCKLDVWERRDPEIIW